MKKKSNEVNLPPVGQSFNGICTECNRVDEVRMIDGKKGVEGPYDRLCAYEKVHGPVPPFVTHPSNRKEMVYRLVTRKELPRESIWFIFFLRLFLVIFVVFSFFLGPNVLLIIVIIQGATTNLSLVFLMIYSLLMFGNFGLYMYYESKSEIPSILNPSASLTKPDLYDEVSWRDFLTEISKLALSIAFLSPGLMLLISSILLLPLVTGWFFFTMGVILWPFVFFGLITSLFNPEIRVWKMFPQLIGKKGSGQDYLELFESIWNGEAKVEDRTKTQHRREAFLTIIRLVVSFAVGVLFFNYYVPLVENSNLLFIMAPPEPVLPIDYSPINPLILLSIIAGLTTYAVIVSFGMSGSVFFKTLLEYRSPPSDVQYRVIQRHFNGKRPTDKVAKAGILITKLLETSDDLAWQIQCPICRDNVRSEDRDLMICRSCERIFHSDHIETHIASQIALQGRAKCPVCEADLERDLVDFKIETMA